MYTYFVHCTDQRTVMVLGLMHHFCDRTTEQSYLPE